MHDPQPSNKTLTTEQAGEGATVDLEEKAVSARHLLIILGMICQGFSFDVFWLPVLYGLLGWSCLRSRKQINLGQTMETGLLLWGILAAYLFGGDYGYNRLVFVGNALVFYQALLFLRPLKYQEKVATVVISMVHLGVGTQVIANYGFAAVFAGTAILLPRALAELHAMTLPTLTTHSRPRGPVVPKRQIGIIIAGACLFFLMCPRLQLLPAAGTTAGLLRSEDAEELEMADGGGPAVDRLLFRVAGDQISYIKRTVLDEWDGRRWTQSFMMMARRNWHDPLPDTPVLTRQVTLVDAARLGHTIPVDGNVIGLNGGFFQRPYLAEDGSVRIAIAVRKNISYSYKSVPEDPADHLSNRLREHYLKITPQSPQLTSWLQALTENDRDAFGTVNTIARHFQSNFAYEIGAPRIREDTPVDSFIFSERRGHCARFAAAAAVLLRMKGIPSRIGLGWAPTERNAIGEFYNVRSRHAHAWAEAWIKEKGWVICDGTPYGADHSLESRSLRLTLAEWIEYVWYSKIVEFDNGEQALFERLFGEILQGIRRMSVQGSSASLLWFEIIAFIAAAVSIRFVLRRRKTHSVRASETPGEESDAEARGFYERMLKTLKRFGYRRTDTDTPAEFLTRLDNEGCKQLPEATLITETFVRTRYGQKKLTRATIKRIRQALANLRR